MALEGERRRLGANCSMQYELIVSSEEEAYRLLKGQAQLASVLQTNVLVGLDEDTFGQVLTSNEVQHAPISSRPQA